MVAVIFWIPHKFARCQIERWCSHWHQHWRQHYQGVASVAFSLPGNCVWATYNKLTKFPKSEENSIWGICYCGRLELYNKVYLQSQRVSQESADTEWRGGDLKWWDAVITMARSMCRQRNKNTKCPIDAHCYCHCRKDPRITKKMHRSSAGFKLLSFH